MMQNFYSQAYQPYPQMQMLSGRMVDNFAQITANDVPMDGNLAIFPLRDMSEVQIRRWMPNGQISMTSYKPILDSYDNKPNILPTETIKSENEAILERLKALTGKVDDLFERLDKNSRGAKNESKPNT